jgi:hypothetical protein
MGTRVTQATLKRIAKLDAPLQESRNRVAYGIALQNGTGAVVEMQRQQFTRAQRTILAWPRMLSCDEWEALASVHQDQLIASSHEDRGRPSPSTVVIVGPDPADVTHRYKPSRYAATG